MNKWVALFCFLCCTPAVAARMESLSIKERGVNATVLLTATGPIHYQLFTLSNPTRVVLDFDQTTIGPSFNTRGIQRGLLSKVRIGHPKPRVLRIVFDLKDQASVKSLAFQPPSPNQHGLRLDFLSKNTMREGSSRPPFSRKPRPQLPPARALRDVVVVLDPGHGGKDPGATGLKRTAEKNVVLVIANKLKRLIDREPGMRAVLTRKGDYYVGLRERLNIARKDNADVFVSIHADAFINHHSNGASVFALSQTGATSEAARWLAEKENYSELGGVHLSGLDDRSGLIRTVLLDLSQTATISASLQMGKRVLHDLDKMTNLHKSKVEQARFVVLKSPDIPSILIETGFITNPTEEKNLTNSYYQNQLTLAIFNGLKRYFQDYPPHGSRLESKLNASLHIVKKGESLPSIAKRYHVSVAIITAANHLPAIPLKVGQKLTIPSSWA